ncbi:hypothetical protein [Trinickia acidisoli]|uniref:hypothetical protein n=1 Tax=Trinickia acidisoli TaxID=2767482 RepID=UPI001A8F7446|nr:hypothetical protein [Trinickia acidisoli]
MNSSLNSCSSKASYYQHQNGQHHEMLKLRERLRHNLPLQQLRRRQVREVPRQAKHPRELSPVFVHGLQEERHRQADHLIRFLAIAEFRGNR